MLSFNIFRLAFFVLLLSSCQSNLSSGQVSGRDSLLSINLENREEFILPAELDEISGHTFVQGKPDYVYCIQDELGEVYVFNLKTKTIESTISFGKDGDYEGITNDGAYFYVLKSNGSIYSFSVDGDSNGFKAKEFKGLLGKGEYESIGIDTVNKVVAIICKDCKVDHKKDQVTGYLLDYSNTGDLKVSKSFSIDLENARGIYAKFPKVFNPSAITKNSFTNEWYILSSIDKLILIMDGNFNPKTVIPFSRKSYEQPEGIAFDSEGNLYISSERGSEKSGMLYKIKK